MACGSCARKARMRKQQKEQGATAEQAKNAPKPLVAGPKTQDDGTPCKTWKCWKERMKKG